jgi:hypothetical protein
MSLLEWLHGSDASPELLQARSHALSLEAGWVFANALPLIGERP